jgi:SET domain-containing protein
VRRLTDRPQASEAPGTEINCSKVKTRSYNRNGLSLRKQSLGLPSHLFHIPFGSDISQEVLYIVVTA